MEYAGNEWQMPPKVYLDASPNGDFRAMRQAKGAGLAILKWVTSFPRNPGGQPAGGDGNDLRLLGSRRRAARAGATSRAVTALRTGAGREQIEPQSS